MRTLRKIVLAVLLFASLPIVSIADNPTPCYPSGCDAARASISQTYWGVMLGLVMAYLR